MNEQTPSTATLVLTCESRDSDKLYFQHGQGAAIVHTRNGVSVRLNPEAVAQAHAWLGAFLGLPQPTPEHPPVFASNVPFEDIQAGDTVRRTRKGGGITCMRTGIAHHLEVTDSWYTEDDSFIASPVDAATFDILVRPAKPKLPTERGAFVLFEHKGETRAARKGAVNWVWVYDGESVAWSPEQMDSVPWRLGKVVEA